MKKILAMVAALSVIVSLATAGTIAYLTDTDSDTNVMVMGNVDIEQIEKFEPNSPLLPNTTVTKEVTVKNTGASEAYVRTFIAFEKDPDNIVDYTANTTDWTWNDTGLTIYVDDGMTDVAYDVYEVVYNKALDKGETTPESLLTVFMKPEATNAQVAKFNGQYTVLVLSQAVQTAGFTGTTAEAFATAFQGGADQALTAEMVQKWFVDANANEDPTVNPPAGEDLTTEDIVAAKKKEFIAGTTYNVYSDIKGTVNETIKVSTLGESVYFVNADIKSTVNPFITLDAANSTILLADCTFTIPEGAYLIDANGAAGVYYSNLTINGVQVNSSNKTEFFPKTLPVMPM